MTDRISQMRSRLLNTRPSLSSERLLLATEAYKKHAGENIMTFRAHVFSEVLDHISVVIRDGELLVGATNKKARCASIFPEYTGQWLLDNGALDRLPTRPTDPLDVPEEERQKILDCLEWWRGRSLEEICDQVLPEDVQNARNAGIIAVGCRSLPSGKTVPDYALMFQRGLKTYIQMCRDQINRVTEHTVDNQPQIDFWNACIIACEAVIRLSNRYADEAERLAGACNDPTRRGELQEIARICRKVPENPPETFWEALQFEWFIYYLLYVDNNCSACGLGRFDVATGPYYEADLAAGRITREQAKELIECLFIKSMEIVQVRPDDYSRDFAGYPLWQILMIGGVDRQGNDVTNEVTRLTLEAARTVREDYLQQNAFDDADTYTSLPKQFGMLKAVLNFYYRAKDALAAGADIDALIALPVREKIARAKMIPEDQVAAYLAQVEEEIDDETHKLLEEVSASC